MAKSVFLLHPRQSFREDLAWAGREMANMSEKSLEELCNLLPPQVTPVSKRGDDSETIGWLGVIPLKGSQIISDNISEQREMKIRALEKINMAIEMALDEAKGEHLVVGLGALTAPITNQGQDLLKTFGRRQLSVTTGNAFTAFITIKSVLDIAVKRNVSLEKETIAVLGATGSVGGAVSEHFGSCGCNMILMARNENKLKFLKEKIIKNGGREDRVSTSTNINDLKKAKIVIVTTSSSQVLVRPEHCAPGAIIYDDTQPRNTSGEILVSRPDVLVLDGGVVETPGIDYGKINIGLPPGRSYACLSETLMLAKEGCTDDFTGNVTLEQVERIGKIASKYKDEFYLAPFTSFGKEIKLV
ncbi:MAG: hypothetical protein ABFD23_00785 [Caldisericales bacterium]|nr:hypothetical protein [bacterium]